MTTGPGPLWAAIGELSRLTELMERRRQQLARSVDLTPQQWRLLEEIAQQDFMPSLFARSRDCTPAAVSRVLRRLLERGLVQVAIGSSDARRRDYTLTPAGRRVLDRLRTSRGEALQAIWSDFGAADLERFAAFGRELADRLEAYAETASAPLAPGGPAGAGGTCSIPD